MLGRVFVCWLVCLFVCLFVCCCVMFVELLWAGGLVVLLQVWANVATTSAPAETVLANSGKCLKSRCVVFEWQLQKNMRFI